MRVISFAAILVVLATNEGVGAQMQQGETQDATACAFPLARLPVSENSSKNQEVAEQATRFCDMTRTRRWAMDTALLLDC
jgi:hypothetical protein